MAGETGYVWNKIITSGPPRSGVAAYDSDRHMAVMFACGNEDFSNSTWEFDGTTWREIAISGTRPHGRDHSCKIVYDAFHKKMIMQGGWWNDDNDNTTWEYKVTGTGPNDRAWVGIANVDCAFRGALAMAYDSKRHMILSFGGNHWQSFYNDTWQFNGNDNSWTKLNNWGPTRFGAGLVYDSKRDKFVMFGGVGRWWSGDYENGRGNTCEFDPESGIWKEIISEGTPGTPGPRLIPYNTMIYNQVEDITYLMGGNRNSDNFIFKDLWAYDGTSWTEIPSPSDSPSSGTLWYDTDAKKIMQYNAPNTYMLTKTAIE
jgi:hypothetical protein